MLNLIGIGLNDEKDITLKGLALIKKSKKVYLENYTSVLNVSIETLEKLYGKKIILADRKLIEEKFDLILNESKNKNISILIIGDVFSATTHIDLFLQAKKRKINVNVVNNASVLTAVGITGLQLYKFGKISSIPFHEAKTPYDALKFNLKNNLHTLLLLDLNPEKREFLTIKTAIKKLIDLENKYKNKIFNLNTKCVACAQLGSKNPKIKFGKAKDLMKTSFGSPPYCLIVPGKLHFMEEEALEVWK